MSTNIAAPTLAVALSAIIRIPRRRCIASPMSEMVQNQTSSMPRESFAEHSVSKCGEEQLNNDCIRNVDKERAQKRHDEERHVRGPVALRYGGHVRHRSRRGTEGEAYEAA